MTPPSTLPAPLFDANGGRKKIESLSQPVDQIPLVRKMHLRLCARSKYHEGRWARSGLRHVQDLQSALPGNRRPRLFQMLFKEGVQPRSRDSQIAGVIRALDQIGQLDQALPGQSRDENDRGVIEKLHRVANLLFVLVDGVG